MVLRLLQQYLAWNGQSLGRSKQREHQHPADQRRISGRHGRHRAQDRGSVGRELLLRWSSYGIGASSIATLTIADNDNWQVETPPVLDANASEGSSNDGLYAIMRSCESDMTYGLTVRFLISGTATYPADYAPLVGPDFTSSAYAWQDDTGKWLGEATIPAGQTNVSLRLDAVSDSYIENDELATLTITDAEASGYGALPYVIVAANALVTIRDDGQGTIPTVTITAPDSSAFEPMQSEDQADSGQFLIKRTGDTMPPWWYRT